MEYSNYAGTGYDQSFPGYIYTPGVGYAPDPNFANYGYVQNYSPSSYIANYGTKKKGLNHRQHNYGNFGGIGYQHPMAGPTLPTDKDGVSVERKVENMMNKMGFVQGKGLGKRLQGETSVPNIKVQRSKLGIDYKKETKGVKFGLFLCTLCNKTCNNYSKIEAHLSSKKHFTAAEYKTSGASGKVRCMFCNVSFDTLEDIKIHSSTVEHNTDLKDGCFAVCEICSLVISSQTAYDDHIKTNRHKAELQKAYPLFYPSDNNPTAISPTTAVPTLLQPTSLPIFRPQTSEYFCEVCNIDLTAPKPYQQHIEGRKHMTKAKKGEQINN